MSAAPPEPGPWLPVTKIVATLGPASVGRIEPLIAAGVSVFRVNFSHGERSDHAHMVSVVRAGAHDAPIAILGDLPGPKVRITTVPDGGFFAPPGSRLIFERGRRLATSDGERGPFRLGCTYDDLVREVQPGHRVLINDGAIRALAIESGPDHLTARVIQAGTITTAKGVNVPDTELALGALTSRDREHVAWAVSEGLDFLALSFVKSAADVEELRALIRAGGGDIPIVAKIELPAAVRRMDEISRAADGIMVARGDLGVEMDLAEVPILQKQLVDSARRHGTPCIVATQMLESMIEEAAPTRAEVSDVATAIFDGADAVMLSGETAVGRFPVLCVEHMRRVADRVGHFLAERRAPMRLDEIRTGDPGAALAHGVWTIARDIGAAAILVWSEDGHSATDLSRHEFGIPIVAATSDPQAARRMNLLNGVIPWCTPVPDSMPRLVAAAEERLRDHLAPGAWFVLAAGDPLGVPGVAKRLSLHELGA